MTFNQVINEIKTICESHAMIKAVKYETPVEWINRGGVPYFPLVNYSIGSGSYNLGRELTYRIELWILDKSGSDGEYETEVISDCHLIAGDIISVLRKQPKDYLISNSVTWISLSEKFEDYLSGVKLTFDLSATNVLGPCDMPTI